MCAEKCRHKSRQTCPCRAKCQCERVGCSHGWTARVRDANNEPADMTFEKKVDAQAYERKVLDAKDKGVAVRPKNLRTTFLEYSKEWVERPGRRPGTQESYEMNMAKHIQPAFGGMLLHRIDARIVQRWIDHELIPKGLAPRTVHLIYKTFRACINSAVRKRIIPYSPCVDIVLPEVTRKRIVPATREQVWALYEAMPAFSRALIMVGVGCGLRSGEAFGLCRDSIDFEAGTLTVQRQVVIMKHKKSVLVDYNKTKTSHGREVPLPAFVHRALLEHLDTQSVLVDEQGREILFRSSRGNIIRRNAWYKTFKRALEQAGLPETFRFHDLRHSFASHALDQGVAESTVQLYMGHASPDELREVYRHQVKGAASRDRKALEAVFFEETDKVEIPDEVFEDGEPSA
ncbi:site-specific integrase [Streptomyces sp. NBC_01335]|uniref:tyrosine-type recombinase/integrase n=1 Tax=Streptomyces sp. NBC_01335 TaxID=2903828 RepID=UPI002E1074B9|nr:site-specific integrase [Streptomyces sp. NBC_01335]